MYWWWLQAGEVLGAHVQRERSCQASILAGSISFSWRRVVLKSTTAPHHQHLAPGRQEMANHLLPLLLLLLLLHGFSSASAPAYAHAGLL